MPPRRAVRRPLPPRPAARRPRRPRRAVPMPGRGNCSPWPQRRSMARHALGVTEPPVAILDIDNDTDTDEG